MFVCLLVWAYSLCVSTPPLFDIANKYIPEGFLTTCSYDYLSKDILSRIFVLTMFFTSYIVPLTMIILSYTGIILSMKHSTKQFTGSDDERKRTEGEARNFVSRQKAEFELVRSCIYLIALWTIAWTPYAIVSLVGLFTDGHLITPEVSMYPAAFAKCASLIDSYVYGLSHPAFKKVLESKLIFLGLWNKNSGIKKTIEITSAHCNTFSRSETDGTDRKHSVAV